MTATLLASADPIAPQVSIGAQHLDQATMALWIVLAAVVMFFVLRPELWKRLWLERVDPRGAALGRIALGITVLWSVIDLAVLGEFLFTDQGLWMTDMARKNYGGQLKNLWDPEHGFESWTAVFEVLTSKWTILHVRSDPPFVTLVYVLMMIAALLMTLGWRTRWTTIATWLLVTQIYNYSPIWYAGGDTVLRVMLFLGMFASWGEAYSLDSWRRRRRAILAGADQLPALRKIAAWPLRIMMLQLAIVYSATGLLKSGGTWWGGSALYYAMNLDHFYRVPTTHLITVLHYAGVLPVLTWVVHWWEMLFPVALIGVAVQAHQRDRASGTWPWAPRWRRWLSWSLLVHFWLALAFVVGLTALYYYKAEYIGLREGILTNEQARWLAMSIVLAIPVLALGVYRLLEYRFPRGYEFTIRWLLGKRLWLGLGFLFHLGIEVQMNVGTFVQVMWATYPVWLRGSEIEGWWRWVQSRPARAGEGERPVPAAAVAGAKPAARRRRLDRLRTALERPWFRLRYRVPREPYVVHHAPDESSIRRAALLRPWDLSHRLVFVVDEAVAKDRLCLCAPAGGERWVGARAGRQLTRILPGLWPLWPLSAVPGVGRLVLLVLRQG